MGAEADAGSAKAGGSVAQRRLVVTPLASGRPPQRG